jgi:hypothetical protein
MLAHSMDRDALSLLIFWESKFSNRNIQNAMPFRGAQERDLILDSPADDP